MSYGYEESDRIFDERQKEKLDMIKKIKLPICNHCGKPINPRRLASDVCMCEWKGVPSRRPIKDKNDEY